MHQRWEACKHQQIIWFWILINKQASQKCNDINFIWQWLWQTLKELNQQIHPTKYHIYFGHSDLTLIIINSANSYTCTRRCWWWSFRHRLTWHCVSMCKTVQSIPVMMLLESVTTFFHSISNIWSHEMRFIRLSLRNSDCIKLFWDDMRGINQIYSSQFAVLAKTWMV